MHWVVFLSIILFSIKLNFSPSCLYIKYMAIFIIDIKKFVDHNSIIFANYYITLPNQFRAYLK